MLEDPRDPIPIAAPDLGAAEEAALIRVLRSGSVVQGAEVEALEREFAEAAGVAEAVAVANGTLGLYAALRALGVGPGDEVLVPAFTFAATANAALGVGAVPVFVDVGEDHLIDLGDAAARVTGRTAAVIPVHLYGLMADMEAVEAFAGRHGLAVVEDAAQAHLAERGGRGAGATGVGVFSLYATKNMTSAEGGLVTTSDPGLARELRLLRNHGMAARYEHVSWGLNLRLTDLAAAMGRVQLAKLPEATRRRIENARYLDEALPEMLGRPPVAGDATHVYHQYTVRVPASHRDRFLDGFRRRGVGAEVYYPRPVHHQPAFRHLADPEGYPRAEAAAREVLSLPVHPGVDEVALKRIVEAAHQLVEEAP